MKAAPLNPSEPIQGESNIQSIAKVQAPIPILVEADNPVAVVTAINSLAPKILTDQKELERVQPYLELLKKTIDSPGITNIALTGNYGSGKSTIINTFQNQHDEYEYLRISLASFGNITKEIADITGGTQSDDLTPATGKIATISPSPNNDVGKSAKVKKVSKEKKEELERLLEISILQQIFYHVKPSAIPDSRFKRIINIKDETIYLMAFSFALWIASAFILFKFDYIDRINPGSWDTKLHFDWIALPVFAMFFSGIGYFAKSIVRLLNNSKINKVNIKGELELGDKLDKSVFNEHLEEILYFFERTSFNLVVIEDLDRFDSTDIFTKLRELNTLLNNSLSIKDRKDHKEIVFLYAINDETFKDKNERVKFFEYIIPVIPFINPSNAGDQLAKLISEAKIDDVKFKEFTEDLVTFIDDIDMRLLTNIFHEYQLYRKNLGEVLQQDKLFAMITYKNMFPEDFSKLHSRKGNLYQFLSNRETYVKKLINEIDEQIAENLIAIDNIESVQLESLEELKAIYINAIFKKLPEATALKIGKKISFAELIKEDNFNAFTQVTKIEYYHQEVQPHYGTNMYREYTNTSNLSFSDIENEVNQDFSYDERVEQILDAEASKDNELKSENDKLKAKKLEIESWSFSEIFEQVDIDPYIKHFSDSGLIRNLLLNGYIDENYHDYISLFHEVNMSSEDFVFEKNVKSGTISAFDYKLTYTSYLAKKLHWKYFKREVILNLDMVDYFLNEIADSDDKKDSVFTLLASERKRAVSFIDDFVNKRPESAGKFMNLIVSFWKNCWNFLEKKSGYSEEKLDGYLQLLIVNASIEDLISQGPGLSTYISKKSDFLSLFKNPSQQQRVETAINKLGIRFINLNPSTTETQALFDFVYNNNYYLINIANILLMLREKATNMSEENIKKSNFSSIQNSECEQLKKYVSESINIYIKEVFLKLPGNSDEAEEQVLVLLNNSAVKDELKTEIIEGDYLIVNDLSAVGSFDLQRQILYNDRMNPTWRNIFIYYEAAQASQEENKAEEEESSNDAEFDESLLDYLNEKEHYEILSTGRLSDDDSRVEGFIRSFAIEIVKCEPLSFDAYAALMQAHSFNFLTVDIKHLSDNKVNWLVENGRLLLNNHNFNQLKEHFPGQHIRLLEIQQRSFSDKLEQIVLDEDDTISLLESSVFSKENKLLIYDQLDEETITDNAEIARLSCKLLATEKGIDLSYEIIESMFRNSRSTDERIRILNMHIGSLSTGQVKTLIEILGGDYPEIFIKRHKPKFSRVPFHEELFRNLKSKQMIIKFEPYDKDENLFKVYANY